jgi:sugar lactone lactonase YvrE
VTIDPVSVCPLGATLGEGPVWVARDAALWLTDIKGQQLHRFDPVGSALRSWAMPDQPGWALPASDGGMIVGLKTGLHRFDPASGAVSEIIRPEPALRDNRLNDATVAADGTLWFGSMDDREEAATGRLYRWSRGVLHETGLDPVVITNGPAFSPCGRTLYHTDTLGRRIWAVLVQDDGSLGPARLFVEIEDGAGYPDGPTVDADGHVWTGLFGGWACRRYDPDGRLVAVVRFPVANVTKIAFGGPDLRTAYATTARKGLDTATLAKQPRAGDIFAFEPGVVGLSGHTIMID